MEKKEPKLINLKPGKGFYLSGIRYMVLVKYDDQRIKMQRIRDEETLELNGNLKIIPIPRL